MAFKNNSGTAAMLGWLRDYRQDWLRPDLIAGLTTAAAIKLEWD